MTLTEHLTAMLAAESAATKGKWSARLRKKGDIFNPLGARGKVKLKKFFIDNKVPKPVRDRVPILIDTDKIVWVVGYRNGYMAAFYAQALLSQLRTEVHLLNEGSGEDAELLAEIQSGDVLLAMDFRRRTRRLSQVVGIACEAGAALVLVSDARV